MLITFKSKAYPDVMMYQDHAKRILDLLNKEPEIGVITSAEAERAVTAATVCGAVLSTALVNLWTGRPTPRGEFMKRGKRSMATVLLELCGLLSWAGLALLLPRVLGAAPVGMALAGMLGATAAIALGTVPLAWLLRHRAR